MPNYPAKKLQSLKNAVLVESGLPNLATSDCKNLERLIFKKTNLHVSETTLKRVYGFALSNVSPSLFTVNTLSKYSGYKNWDDYCKQQDDLLLKEATTTVDWNELKVQANKITSFTLQALKNKSGIPYAQTIKRKFVENHFEDFFNSDHVATVLTAPAGYGKTLALCHWIDEKLQKHDDDILLFFSGNALMNVFLSGRDLNGWILSLLGYSTDGDIVALLDIEKKKGGSMCLIIDGLDEQMFKPEQFQLIINQISDIFSFYQSQRWFKLILTMRSSTWVNNKNDIELGQSIFYKGFLTSLNPMTNVPLFNFQELNELSYKINPNQNVLANDKTAETLKYPLYFQFYYKQNTTNFSLGNFDNTTIYEMVASYILHKVYSGAHSAEKMFFILALIDELDFRAKKYEIPKLKIVHLIRQYNNAYNDLLSLGFLREFNNSNEIDYDVTVQFGNTQFLEFSVSKSLLSKHNNSFGVDLIINLNEILDDNEHKLHVLKCCVYYAVKSGQFEDLDALNHANLSSNEKLDLVTFLGVIFKKENVKLYKTDLVIQFFQKDLNSGLFDYMFGVEFICDEYAQTLQSLLKFKLSNKKKVLIYTCLATKALLKLEINLLEEYLTILNGFSIDDFEEFPINPYNCLNAIYYYCKYGLINKDVLAEITRFTFHPPAGGSGLIDNPFNDMIYLLAIYTLKIAKNPFKTLRFINVVEKHYKPISDAVNVYNFFVKRIMCEESFFLGKIKKGLKIYENLDGTYNSDNDFTPFLKSSFNNVEIMVGVYTDHDVYKNDGLQKLYITNAQYEYKVVKLYILAFLLKNKHALKTTDQVLKNINYGYVKMVRNHGLNETVFL